MKNGITPLKKVQVGLRILTDDGQPQKEAVSLSFVYGAASGGLLPFERVMGQLDAGEWRTLAIGQDEMHEMFGYLLPTMKAALNMVIFPQTLHLAFSVERVEDCSQREVIAAISAAVGSGCGGDCGCGCC